ncbi:MAG: tryptophan-rich sensory protein, partial [Parvularculaceae bacterium]
MRKSRPIAVAAAAAIGVAILGGAMTDIGPWYRALEKSSLNPPDWLFAPAWSLIYALAAASAVLGWRAVATARARAILISLFFANAVLNILWTFFFFTLR